jgi:hypothetical protein
MFNSKIVLEENTTNWLLWLNKKEDEVEDVNNLKVIPILNN